MQTVLTIAFVCTISNPDGEKGKSGGGAPLHSSSEVETGEKPTEEVRYEFKGEACCEDSRSKGEV